MMRHVRLHELSGCSLAEQVIIAVHLHGYKKRRKKKLRVGTRRLFCVLDAFWLVMMMLFKEALLLQWIQAVSRP